MKFTDFKKQFEQHWLIDARDIDLTEKPDYLRRLMNDWLKKNQLIQLRRGLYVINEKYFTERLSQLYIANLIYQPSYISLEYALSYYGMIPEAVRTYTSVSTRKTANFENSFGIFSYQKIKNSIYFGYEIIKINKQNILVASKEKALLDFLYLNLANLKEDKEIFYSYRLQNLEDLNLQILEEYATKYKSQKLLRILDLLPEYIEENRMEKL